MRLTGILAELETIVMYLDRYSDEEGCGAKSHTLAKHCGRGGVPITERTLERRLKFLHDHELVGVFWKAGRRMRRVDWDRIRGYALPAPANFESSKVAEGSAKVAAGSAKMADRHYKELLAPSLASSSSPLTPSKHSLGIATRPANLQEGEGEDFFRWVEGELRTRGMVAVELVVRSIKRRGLPPTFVRQVFEHFDRHAPAWSAGALCTCFRRAMIGDDPTAEHLWPPPSQEFLRQQRLERALAQAEDQQERQAAERRRVAAERRARVDREARLGGLLDGMAPAEFEQLVATVFRTEAERGFFVRDLAVWPIVRRDLRELLLLQLDQQSSKQEVTCN